MSSGRWHEVQQGESVETIAARAGCEPQAVWEHPQNTDLRAQRKNPHILMPGDRLFIPPAESREVEVQTGRRYTFVVKRPRSRLRLKLFRDDTPWSKAKFTLAVDRGSARSGVTDSAGMIDCEVSAEAMEAVLTVGEGASETVYRLALRALDPVDTPTGLQARLQNLGYDVGPVDGELGDQTAAALRAFQADHGLPATGELDDATLARLEADHGC